jgi:AcrR family transcriptional regulator
MSPATIRKRRRLSPEDRRQELLAATQRVIEQYGYADSSVPRVVAEADTAQGNFYRYFKNLDDAFLALVRTLLEPVQTAAFGLDFSTVTTPRQVEEVLLTFYRQLGRLLAAHAKVLREVLLVGQAAPGPVGREITAFLNQMRALAKLLIDTHMQRPPFRPTMDSEIVAGAIVGMIVGAVQDASLLGKKFDSEKWAIEMARLETGALVDPGAYANDRGA